MAKSLFQTPFWVEFKAKGDWQVNSIADIFVLTRRLPLGSSFAYAPEVSEQNWETWLPKFTAEIKNFTTANRLVFARLEILEPLTNPKLLQQLVKTGYIKAFEEVQPETRQIIDLNPTEDDILAHMKPKGRYNIKIAKRHDVTIAVHQSPDQISQDAAVFYQLMVQTGQRQGFSVRPQAYFEQLLTLLYTHNLGGSIIASYQDKPLACLIISFYDGVASYLYGASSLEHRETMAPYLAHWEAIKLAKARHCRTYDLLAIAPVDKPNHKYADLTRFKEQFGGARIQLIGSWDLIFKPFWYTMFRRWEKRRRHI